MKRKLPTVLVLMVMVLVGAMYWIDLAYHTDVSTGFVTRGPLWARYIMAAVPVLMGLLGLRTVGPKSISALRVKSVPLGVLFGVGSLLGVLWGGGLMLTAFSPVSVFRLVVGILAMFYSAWMFLAAVQMFTQTEPSPTKSAIWGILASLPFCLIAANRVMVDPSSIHRVSANVSFLSPIIIFMWFGMLLRSFYIALPRRRVRGLYLLSVLAFMFAACLELPQVIFMAIYSPEGVGAAQMLEAINLGVLGLAAAFVALQLAGRGDYAPEKPIQSAA